MSSLLTNALYAASTAAVAYVAKSTYTAVKAYISPENYEDKYLTAANEALGEMKVILTPFLKQQGFSDEMIDHECSDFSRVKNVIGFLKGTRTDLNEAASKRFTDSVEKYQKNLDQFQKYSGASAEENFQSVKQELSGDGIDKAKLTARAHHFESRIICEGLSKGDTCEEGAYAKVLDTREKLRLAIQVAKPNTTITFFEC